MFAILLDLLSALPVIAKIIAWLRPSRQKDEDVAHEVENNVTTIDNPAQRLRDSQ